MRITRHLESWKRSQSLRNFRIDISNDLLIATCNIDESFNTLDTTELPPRPKKSTKDAVNEEQLAKAELWKALEASLSSGTATSARNNTQPYRESVMQKKLNVFGTTVAHSLMQCDPNDWMLLKKEVMGAFFEYNVQKRNSLGFNYPTTLNMQQRGNFSNMLQSSQMSRFNINGQHC